MWGRAVALAVWLAGSTVLPAPAQQAVAIRGRDEVTLLPPPGVSIEPYADLGYRLQRVGDHWRIDVDASPIMSRAGFRVPPRASTDTDEIDRLARRLTASEVTVYDAASRVLDWVARNIQYRLDRSLPQDAEAVLERRTGYCTGIARLTVRLLAAVGIEAREVPGYVVAAAGSPGGIVGYHRWVEIHYPDRGWAFSDPIASHHYVPATYLRLASDRLDPLWAGSAFRILGRQRDLLPVDVYPSAAGITARRNDDVQLAAALLVKSSQATSGAEVTLSGEAIRQVCQLTDQRCIFVGLPAGKYEVTMTVAGKRRYRGRVWVHERQRLRLRIPEVDLQAEVR